MQRDARRDDEPAGVTHWKPSTVDLGKRCDPRRWSFVEFPAPGADVAVDVRAMGLFLVCFDNNYRGAALARSVARGGTADDEDVASVNNLVSNFHTHPDAASVFSVFDDVSSVDVKALASGAPPAPSLRQLLMLCLKTMAEEGRWPSTVWIQTTDSLRHCRRRRQRCSPLLCNQSSRSPPRHNQYLHLSRQQRVRRDLCLLSRSLPRPRRSCWRDLAREAGTARVRESAK